jgi:hypothetical protein
MITPKAYRVYVYGKYYERKFDACFDCTQELIDELVVTESIQAFGYGTSKHIEDMPPCCDICAKQL